MNDYHEQIRQEAYAAGYRDGRAQSVKSLVDALKTEGKDSRRHSIPKRCRRSMRDYRQRAGEGEGLKK